ncbi:MAG TPA: nucleoside-diphosphate kinase [Dehalococcoidia bacterium]|nr:nucleoside-diphosphate kinase [Dehalococcoidia bacterium]
MERTLVLVKPDGVQRGLVGAIISRLEQRGLKLVALKMLWLDEALAQRLYAIHRGKPFFERLIKYVTACPLVAAVFEGEGAVALTRQAMGETDPARASPGSIRGDFGIDIGRNLVHGSDSVENAQPEIDLFFTPQEIYSYPRDTDSWIFE